MFDSRTDRAHSQTGVQYCQSCCHTHAWCEKHDVARTPRVTVERLALVAELADATDPMPVVDDVDALASLGEDYDWTGGFYSPPVVVATIVEDAPAKRVPGSSAGSLPIVGLGAKKRRANWAPRVSDGRRHPVTVTHI